MYTAKEQEELLGLIDKSRTVSNVAPDSGGTVLLLPLAPLMNYEFTAILTHMDNLVATFGESAVRDIVAHMFNLASVKTDEK